MSKLKARAELLQKAFRKWAVEYHFVIPPAILKQYIHKFLHESSNITKYSVRYYDPHDAVQYGEWLKLQEYEQSGKVFADLTVLTPDPSWDGPYPACVQKDVLDLSGVSTSYVCIMGDQVTLYPESEAYLPLTRQYDLLYFDHDGQKDGARAEPVLKPDFSYNTLRGFNYIGNCWAVRTSLLKQFEGQPWKPYRWLLELSDQKIRIGHVQKILYNDTEPLKDEAETVRAYFRDHGIGADVTVNPDGISRTVWYHTGQPRVSIVIPTKDGKDVLKTCIDSIYEKTTYRNFEIIIADNNSEKQETMEYFRHLEEEHDNLKVFRIECPFNFSLINNRAVEKADGEYIVMLNNDTSVITPDWLEKMLSYCTRDNVGSVGVKLWYPDDTIQHGGVIIGKGGAAAHRYYRCPHDQKGYLFTLEMPNDVSCCTAACLMVKKKCWEELGGMNEELTVQFNDVDLALRLLKAGYCNVFLPEVELYHYESKSRGIDKDKKAVERYVKEVKFAKQEWAEEIRHDPFYNDNFDKNYDYQLIVGTGSN